MPRNTSQHIRLSRLVLCATLLGGTAVLSSGCGQEDQKAELASETKAFENTSNKIGNAIKAIADSRPMFNEGRPPIMQAGLDVFWMNVTSTRLGLARFLRDIEATPELKDKARNLWIGRIQDSFVRAESEGTFSSNGPVAKKLGAAFGEERVVEEFEKIDGLATRIRDTLSIDTERPDSDG